MPIFRPVERRGAVATGSPAFNPFENPAVPLASVGFDGVWGTEQDAGEAVTVEGSLVLPIVYRCVDLLTNVIASCPLQVWRKRDLQEIDNPLFDPANDEMTYTPYELVQLSGAYMALWGNTFIFKKRDNFDRIIDLKPLYPDLVEVKVDREGSGRKIFLVKHLDAQGNPDEGRKPQVFTDFEIMHIQRLGIDGMQGLSPIQQAQRTVGTAIAGDRLAGRFLRNGSQLGGIIKIKAPLKSQAQAEGIKARWNASHAGVAAAGDVAVLDAETDYQNVTIPPDQLQFLESRRWQTTEIARMFGIPPHLVGDVEKSTSWGTGIEVQNIGFEAYTISAYTTPYEQRTTREVVNVRGQYAAFDMTKLMRGSTQERYGAYATALGAGWITGNEVRKKENMKPLKGLNKPFPPKGGAPQLTPDGQPNPGPGSPPPGSDND